MDENALVLVRSETEYRIAWAEDPEDWIVSFEKNANFPAYAWAERMLILANVRKKSNTPFPSPWDPSPVMVEPND